MFNTRQAEAKYLTMLHRMREEEITPACADRPEIFFPDGYDNLVKLQIREANDICSQCPLKTECFDYAIEAREEYGIWAGTTPDERREILRAKYLAKLS
jgi:WhiB family redox-sensing transcriptional regulator